MLAEYVSDLRREFPGELGALVAGLEIEGAGTTLSDLVDARKMGRQMTCARLLPEDHMTAREDESGARRVMRCPYHHVRCIHRIADIDGIEHQDPGEAPILQFLDQPRQPMGTHALEVGNLQTASGPFLESLFGWSDLDPIIVRRRAVRLPGGRNLPCRLKRVHGCSRVSGTKRLRSLRRSRGCAGAAVLPPSALR